MNTDDLTYLQRQAIAAEHFFRLTHELLEEPPAPGQLSDEQRSFVVNYLGVLTDDLEDFDAAYESELVWHSFHEYGYDLTGEPDDFEWLLSGGGPTVVLKWDRDEGARVIATAQGEGPVMAYGPGIEWAAEYLRRYLLEREFWGDGWVMSMNA